MAIELNITTTGTLSSVPINDLGKVPGYTHPTTTNLLLEFTLSEISNSEDLQTAVNNGYLTITNQNNALITDLNNVSNSFNTIINISSHTNSSSWKKVTSLFFQGSDHGIPPKNIYAIAKQKNFYSTGGVRVMDITNNNIIASATITDEDYAIINLGELTNISKSNAIWEIQIKKSYIDSLTMEY